MATWKVSNLELDLDEPEELLAAKLADKLQVTPDVVARTRILRRSLDARQHDRIRYVYQIAAELADEAAIDADHLPPNVARFEAPRFVWPDAPGREPLPARPVIVGSGPAGLVAAYFLARDGFAPVLIERGGDVKDRVADVRRFDTGGQLDPESNYLFGEGGAGTFSDGKLTCRMSGPDVDRVLELLVECHGKPSILYDQRPHLGSNRLPLIVRTLRRKVEELGGLVRFGCRMEDIELSETGVAAAHTSGGRIPATVLILATGHSARDVYENLVARGVRITQKPFQFGVRIEQPQAQIDEARYGPAAGHPALEAADYTLAVRAGACDLFTFCMCAGGYVMPSVSEPGHFCTNGMSESRHDSPFANSGLVITIDPAQHGADPLAGVRFQQTYERAAYLAGQERYFAPIQRAGDFLAGRPTRGNPISSYPRGVVPFEINTILPRELVEALSRGLPAMDRVLRRRFLKDATLVAPEARGSSPVRIPRDPETREHPDVRGLFPCGEGAGYAGGIISAAVDGLRTARAIAGRFALPS